MRKLTLLGLVVFITFCSLTVLAKINFQTSLVDRLDIETIETNKKDFFNFINQTILNREPGLGNYGRVAFHPCDMKIGELKIIDYKTIEGKDIRYLSNPSCHQVVIRKVLENSYQYDKALITSYQNRQCILSVEKIISPMLEYYTLKYEERKKEDCSICDFKEKDRLNIILATQKKIVQHCHSQSEKVMNFISELDSQIETSYKAKTSR